jgi:two-component system cell cycle sensor histidine kinase/response regulator CckA
MKTLFSALRALRVSARNRGTRRLTNLRRYEILKEGLNFSVRALHPMLPNSSKKTILLVEDTAELRTFLARILDNEGYHVIQAANGIEALRLCGDSPRSIDLLLTDVIMPQMGGRELTERLRVENPDLRVIFISGFDASHVGALPAAASFLPKPFSAAELFERIEQALTFRKSSHS